MRLVVAIPDEPGHDADIAAGPVHLRRGPQRDCRVVSSHLIGRDSRWVGSRAWDEDVTTDPDRLINVPRDHVAARIDDGTDQGQKPDSKVSKHSA